MEEGAWRRLPVDSNDEDRVLESELVTPDPRPATEILANQQQKQQTVGQLVQRGDTAAALKAGLEDPPYGDGEIEESKVTLMKHMYKAMENLGDSNGNSALGWHENLVEQLPTPPSVVAAAPAPVASTSTVVPFVPSPPPAQARPPLPLPPPATSLTQSTEGIGIAITSHSNESPLIQQQEFFPSTSSSTITTVPILVSRTSAPLPSLPPGARPASVALPTRANSAGSDPQDYSLPLQFPPGITSQGQGQGGRTSTSSSSNYRQSQSNIPSFVPAPAFSVGDRGPYPPVQRNSVVGSSGVGGQGGGGGPGPSRERESYYNAVGMGLIGVGMDGPYPMGNGRGKGRESEDMDQSFRRGSQYYNSAVVTSSTGAGGDQRPEDIRATRVLSGDFGESLAGIGRNSLVRNSGGSGGGGGVGAMSPTPQNLHLGSNGSPNGAVGTFSQQQQQQQQNSPPQPSLGKQHQVPQPHQPVLQPSPTVQAQQAILTAASPPTAILNPPPHLVPQPEICVECMMRDRDMIDVDVTGEGIWARDSDVDFDDVMRWEEEGSTSEEKAGGSREGLAGGSRDSHQRGNQGRGKRLGRGQPLTTASLKLWTSMNPPASAHRWRTLQTFIATQIHLLELERHAREATAVERERHSTSSSSSVRLQDVRQSAPALLGSLGAGRTRSSTLLPNGLVMESINVDRDEKQLRSRAKSRQRTAEGERDRSSYHLQSNTMTIPLPADDDSASVRQYHNGDQPWLGTQSRRFSSPALKDNPPQTSSSASSVRGFSFGKFARSSIDLRSIASPRSISPGRTSIGVDDRRTSMWSRFRRSASHSVLSFAPSGSMVDMHLGMSMDKHASYAPYETYPSSHPYPSMSDPAVARHADAERARALAVAAKQQQPTSVKKKKGIKGFFSKFFSGGEKGRHDQTSEPITSVVPAGHYYDDDGDFLVPPPPLSALANEPRYHNRSMSNSSVDSVQQPFTPPQHHRPLSNPQIYSSSYSPTPEYIRPAADRGSILTTGSYSSIRSQPTSPIPGRSSYHRPSGNYLLPDPSPPHHGFNYLPRSASPDQVELEREEEILYASVRREKSLPLLPSGALYHIEPGAASGAPT
ncbi:hypothetical protein T439DRAFT_323532 [Meredithblackwellia eburnea MCA 4105]